MSIDHWWFIDNEGLAQDAKGLILPACLGTMGREGMPAAQKRALAKKDRGKYHLVN